MTQEPFASVAACAGCVMTQVTVTHRYSVTLDGWGHKRTGKFFEVFSPSHEQEFFYSRVRQEVVIIYLLYILESQRILTSSWACLLPPMRSSRDKIVKICRRWK